MQEATITGRKIKALAMFATKKEDPRGLQFVHFDTANDKAYATDAHTLICVDVPGLSDLGCDPFSIRAKDLAGVKLSDSVTISDRGATFGHTTIPKVTDAHMVDYAAVIPQEHDGMPGTLLSLGHDLMSRICGAAKTLQASAIVLSQLEDLGPVRIDFEGKDGIVAVIMPRRVL